MTPWKYTDATRRVVARILDDERMESCVATRADVVAWVAEGNAILTEDPRPAQELQDEQDVVAAKAYAKLTALKGMTPAQVGTWVDANVTDLASARDAIKTLAIGMSILARRL